ncbi:MAG: tetratricopeptide repeat protein [Chloroflexi bacterium]|nr:tetratricopeptide repeat protein [Chloroflexota bacterium]
MEEPVPFLTKVLVPARLPAGVRRARLLDLLHCRIPSRLTVLSAGAGCGKTTLLADFAAEVEAPVCWFSLDEYDADPRTFVSYLLASVRQRFPSFGRRTEALLRQPPPAHDGIRTLAGVLTTELAADVPEYVALALDDVHALGDASPVWQLLDYLLAHPPENWHLMLAGRELPLLASLPRLLARGQAIVLRTEDLRFTDQEVQELLRQRWGEQVPESVLRRAQECEGWAAGLVLTGLAAGASGPLARNDREWVFRYLAAEVLDAQAAATRAFLLATSILPDVRPELCDALLERSDSAELLAALAEANLFLTPLQADGEPWYRYHALFREFLSDHLRRKDSARYLALQRRAAALAEARGDWGSALHHCQAAGDAELLAGALARGGEELFRRGRWAELRRAFESLQPEAAERSSALVLLRAQVRLRCGQPGEAERDARTAQQLAQAASDGPAHLRALALQASALRRLGKSPEALGVAEQAVALAESGESSVALAEAWKQAGICHGMLGNLDQSIDALRRSLALFTQQQDLYSQASVANELGMAFLTRGELEQAERYFEQAERLWRGLGNHVALAQTLNNLGMAAYYRGDHARAVEALQSASDTAAAAGYLSAHAYAQASLGDLHRDGGSLPAAEQAYQEAVRLAREGGDEFLVAYLLNARGELRRLQGDPAAAVELSTQALGLASARASVYEQGLYETSLGIAEGERREVARAIELLAQASGKLAGCGARRELARARFHRANALFAARTHAEALEELEAVAKLVDELGYDGFLLPDVRRAPLLLQYAASKHAGGAMVERWAASLGRPGRARSAAAPAAPAYPRVEAFALGQSLVRVDERPVSDIEWRSARSRELFFFLLAERRWVRKEEVIDALWPELEPARCESTFHSNAYRLRRALFPACLQHEHSRYRLNPEVEFWFDAAEFECLVSESDRLPPGPERAARHRDAIALYQGPFLGEFYADWCDTRRSKLELRFMRALGGLADYLMERGEYRRAAELWERALATDCFQEEALQKLMLCCSQVGERASALRHYHRWAEVVRRELNAEPSPQTQRLYQELQSGGDARVAAGHS